MSLTLLEQARLELRRAFELYDGLGERHKAVSAALTLADIEITHGSLPEAAELLRLAGRRLPSEEQTVESEDALLRQRLDWLRSRHALSEIKGTDLEKALPADILSNPRVRVTISESPSVPAQPQRSEPFSVADPRDLLPFAWSGLDAERTILEIERRKSQDLRKLIERRGKNGPPLMTREAAVARPASAMGMQEVFVDYFSDGRRIFAILEFAGEKPRSYQIEASHDEVAQAVVALRRIFDRSKYRPGIDPDRPWGVNLRFIDEVGRRLMPFFDDLKQADLVCFLPHGPLHNFPFHAVRGEDGDPLVGRVGVASCFSRQVLSLMRGENPPEGVRPVMPKKALAVGVAAARERDPEMFFGDGEFLASLGADVTTLEGPERATVSRVIKHMKESDLVHLNCHGLFSTERPLESALLLGDGHEGPLSAHHIDPAEGKKHLTARRLFRERAAIGTVVMRACSSGVTNVRVGDEQEGLLRALIHMGVASCIVTRWKIHIRSSRELLRKMYSYWLKEHLPKGIALQKAQQYMMEHPDSESYRHPYHWAPFILVGDWW